MHMLQDVSAGRGLLRDQPYIHQPSMNVSVLVAGTFVRYFTSGCEQLIAPMTRQGHSVDYYALLTTGQARGAAQSSKLGG